MKQEDKLITALKQADEVFGSQTSSDAEMFANSVRAKLIMQRRARRNYSVVSLVVVGVLSLAFYQDMNRRQSAGDLEVMRGQSQMLLLQSQSLLAAAKELNYKSEQEKEIAKLKDELAQVKVSLKDYKAQQNLVVLRMLEKADNMAKDKASIYQAVEVYQSIIKYFPESEYAVDAKHRLEIINSKSCGLNKI